jgi:addiction module HigA family antidote
MSHNGLTHAIGVPGNRIHAIVNGIRDITGDTDLRLCKFFGLTEGYLLRLRSAYDTMEASANCSQCREDQALQTEKAAKRATSPPMKIRLEPDGFEAQYPRGSS